MKAKVKKGRRISKIKIAKLIILLIIFAVALSVFYSVVQLLIEPTGIFVVENGKISEEETTIGYIIRDEQVISGENYENGIVTIKNQGERVSKGDAVFRYCSPNEEKLEEKIAELDKEIQEAIDGQNTSIYSTDIQLLEKQIEEKLAQIQSTNQISEINNYKTEISSYMIKKAKIAGELSPAGSYINKLISQRSDYENQLNSGQQYIKAPVSGVVSYRIDGYEDVLTANNLDNITKEQLENVKVKTGQTISLSSEQGKIVNNFYCYIATILSSDNAMNVSVGDNVKLRLSNNNEVTAEIVKISDFVNGETVMVFKITKNVEFLMDYRKISIDIIWWDASGLKVPNSAIITEDDKNYVIRSRTGYSDKILVKIKKQNSDYSIVSNYTTDELRELGYTTNEISSMTRISLYDEIVLKPEL